jgi:glutathione synthase/RimK-type ligase-like ATP-grasp enzyme
MKKALDHQGPDCCILTGGPGSWAFEDVATRLAAASGLPVRANPGAFNYLLAWDDSDPPPGGRLFIPHASILAAGDKRMLAEVFARAGVPTPETHLLDGPQEVRRLLASEPRREWALKWPTGCGASGHRLLGEESSVPEDWPRPYVMQEFIRLRVPEVYRLYAVVGETFGWNVRRFPRGTEPSPWVAHARGARYEAAGDPPAAAIAAGRAALASTGLLDTFGCVDLIRSPGGDWLVLEVGTDGVWTHVDRAIDIPGAADDLDRRIAAAFYAWAMAAD